MTGSKGGRTPPDRIEPVRSCSGCRVRRRQHRLVRVVRAPDGSVTVDPDKRGSRAPGRGAYVCPDPECIGIALKGGLRRTLKLDGPLPDDLEERLLQAAGKLTGGRQDRPDG